MSILRGIARPLLVAPLALDALDALIHPDQHAAKLEGLRPLFNKVEDSTQIDDIDPYLRSAARISAGVALAASVTFAVGKPPVLRLRSWQGSPFPWRLLITRIALPLVSSSQIAQVLSSRGWTGEVVQAQPGVATRNVAHFLSRQSQRALDSEALGRTARTRATQHSG